MMCRSLLALPLLVSMPALADTWSFDNRIAVSKNIEAGVFQHLDSSGRKNIAVSGNTLAVAWEDNRSGAPQTYVALKKLEADEFSTEQRISTGKSAFAPAILALGKGRFLAGWEQDGAVWLRTVSATGLGSVRQISRAEAGQIALATTDGRRIIAVWNQRTGRFSQIVATMIKIGVKGETISARAPTPVDPDSPVADQSLPAVVLTKQGATVVWEDRRRGHTALLYSHAVADMKFSPPRPLNEILQKSEQYGRGSGVTRAALSVFGDDQIVATWMDKRGYQTGYDIYAAFSRDNGASFGANELVQDAFADQYAQWHPAVTGNGSGQMVIAWDDDRDGTSDIWLSWKIRGGWSTNLAPPPAADSRQQTNPAIALDTQGNLHLVWLEQEAENSPGRVMYAVGRYLRGPQPSGASTPEK
ncbi:MAG: hypothetical protein HY274_01370 [Gammaproteobacteria bacterium]|nr:hypothetical protein [Gammaproteobacteria bacterium]